ncbi:plasmid mobilization relaxosome protein MobC [Collimonas antrihumi]|uniref:plasmid mobilization relaxosome protein MobC n=1 Tax=Collimonas antrihumi TaxID=1940615 RepID=UPI001FE9A413|nr:plasmid mobilization relaxosome protein MobC [Collimonas antrihumi]
MDKPSRAMNIHLGADLKARWIDYCVGLGKTPGAAIKEAIEQQLEKASAFPQPKIYQQVHEAPSDEPKVRFEILLTQSEKAAVLERADLERCSQRRWIIDAIRAGLTREPQFSMSEIDALGESNYQLLSIGRNLNQIAKRLNEGNLAPVTEQAIDQLREKIDKHTDVVSTAIRASLERWDIV